MCGTLPKISGSDPGNRYFSKSNWVEVCTDPHFPVNAGQYRYKFYSIMVLRMNRQRAITKRWLSIICCGVLGSTIWAIAGDPFTTLMDPVNKYLGSIEPDLLVWGILISTIAICWPLGRRRWLAFFGFRHFGTYAPLWLAIAIALLIIAIYKGMSSSWQFVIDEIEPMWWLITEIPPWMIVTIMIVALLVFVVSKEPKVKGTKEQGDGTDLGNLLKLIRNDLEITHPNDDWFGHNEVALRITKRLTHVDGESPTIAVVGPLGSGKSTIRSLVAYHLNDQPSIQMLHLSLWPFDTAESAVAGILKAVIRSLRDHVNTLAVSGLSDRYVATIERIAGRWGTIAQFLRGESRPEEILNRLAEIATAAGIKLVLWIEDMERFSGTTQLPGEYSAMREADRLSPILSLLYLLDRCDSISVIVGDTTLRSRLDVEKIARFVESPPRPSIKQLWSQIAILRNASLEQNLIYPAQNERRKDLNPPEEGMSLDMWLWNYRETEPTLQVAITWLISTPRALKSALRITWETWETLRGEIDFDSVLAISALRVSQPDVFALIDEYIDVFRQGSHNSIDNREKDNKNNSVLEMLDSLFKKKGETERKRNAVKAVISFVFPSALTDQKSDFDEHEICPQGLSVERHTDYWQRYLTLPEIKEDESDQAALRTIHAWKNGEDNNLISRISHPEASKQIGTFVREFKPAELCKLLIETAQVLSKKSAKTWDDHVHPHELTSIWLMMLCLHPSVKLLSDNIKTIIQNHIDHHLPLIYAVISCFAEDKSSADSNLINSEQRELIRAELRENLIAQYSSGKCKLLLQALQGGSPWILYYLCHFASGKVSGNQLFNGWKGISETLLAAAEENPNIGIAITIPFYTTSELETNYRIKEGTDIRQPIRDYAVTASEERARQLFDFNKLAPLLANTPPSDDLDEAMMARYKAARKMVIGALK